MTHKHLNDVGFAVTGVDASTYQFSQNDRYGQPSINIVTVCDNAYVQHTAIFLKSLFAQNPNTICRVFILVPENFIHRDTLERNLTPHGSSLEFIKINVSKTI